MKAAFGGFTYRDVLREFWFNFCHPPKDVEIKRTTRDIAAIGRLNLAWIRSRRVRTMFASTRFNLRIPLDIQF